MSAATGYPIINKLNVSGHGMITNFVLVLVCGIPAQSLSIPFSNILYLQQTHLLYNQQMAGQ
jgi:hypothetical protein